MKLTKEQIHELRIKTEDARGHAFATEHWMDAKYYSGINRVLMLLEHDSFDNMIDALTWLEIEK